MLVPHIPTIIYQFVGPSDVALLLQDAHVISRNAHRLFFRLGLVYSGYLKMFKEVRGDQVLFRRSPEFRFKFPGHSYNERELTEEDYGKICFLREFTYTPHVPYGNPDIPSHCLRKAFITVRDIERFIEVCEGHARFLPGNDWFGYPDSSHCFFEGLQNQHDGTFSAAWGS